MQTDLTQLTILEALELFPTGHLTPQSLNEACFHRIGQLNARLNAFITVESLERNTDPNNTRNADGLLSGIPVAIKDLIDIAGIRTTAGSKFFTDHIPSEDAFVIEMLKKAGAVLMGKTNTHEIALGVTTVNPHFGVCHNPWDTSRISGGSSGGSAVAVATGMALAAIGTDTGGSIRIPASLCGVVGLKPTYGRVSLRGVLPLSWNLDHIGPITKTVGDAALILRVIAGYDPKDPVSVNIPLGDYLEHLNDGIKGVHIALAVGEYFENCDQEVFNAVREAARVFRQLGAIVSEIDMSFLGAAAQANGLMTQADAAAFHRERLKTHPDWFGDDVRQRLELGASYTSSDYSLARRTQAEIQRRFDLFFSSVDILILPTTPIPAPEIEGNDAVEQARRLTRFTAPFNLTGLPALSVPCGFTRNGLPIGLQIVSRHWAEAMVLQAGYAFEKASSSTFTNRL